MAGNNPFAGRVNVFNVGPDGVARRITQTNISKEYYPFVGFESMMNFGEVNIYNYHSSDSPSNEAARSPQSSASRSVREAQSSHLAFPICSTTSGDFRRRSVLALGVKNLTPMRRETGHGAVAFLAELKQVLRDWESASGRGLDWRCYPDMGELPDSSSGALKNVCPEAFFSLQACCSPKYQCARCKIRSDPSALSCMGDEAMADLPFLVKSKDLRGKFEPSNLEMGDFVLVALLVNLMTLRVLARSLTKKDSELDMLTRNLYESWKTLIVPNRA